MSENIQPGPELDLLVARKVMGWSDEQSGIGNAGHFGKCIVRSDPERATEFDRWRTFEPSTNIADAWEVVIYMSTHRNPDAPALWWNFGPGSFAVVPGYDMTLARIMHDRPRDMPHAICLAALRAVGDGA